MTFIHQVQTANPGHRCNLGELRENAAIWLGSGSEAYALFDRFLSNSRTSLRFYAIPPADVLKLSGVKMRADYFEECALPLLLEVAGGILQTNTHLKSNLGALVFTSCTCPTIPALDVQVIDALRLKRDLIRVPIYQYGCAGGVAGLALASELSRAKGSSLLLSVELCSLVFQPDKKEASDLVGASLFADGAGAVLLSENPGPLKILNHRSYLLPNSTHLMGYNQTDSGAHLRLDRTLPQVLTEQLPEQLKVFLDQSALQSGDIKWWLFHPGGIKILEALRTKLNLTQESCDFAYRVLKNYGNMSSATIIFVINEFLQSGCAQRGDRVLLLGIGPGLTLEMTLLEAQ